MAYRKSRSTRSARTSRSSYRRARRSYSAAPARRTRSVRGRGRSGAQTVRIELVQAPATQAPRLALDQFVRQAQEAAGPKKSQF